jgi:UDP-N-acetylglucosamine--N-acetylmuramyl-(pentapeptide) pyrophosphoryl-undecaprenol N-acetylglucosamine transferase
MVEKDGFAYSTILAGGFKRAISIKNIFSVWKLFLGVIKSFFILKRHKPDVLLVMGGYLSIPPALIAKLFKIPIVMHEQNVKPGLANRVLGRWASRIAVAFDEGKASFQGNVIVTGNPVRPEFLSLPSQAEARGRFSLSPAKKTRLVFGGSLGAKRLNDMVVEALNQMKDLVPAWQVIHISGPSEEARVRAAYANSAFEHHVSGYCHDMAAAYAAADVVLCRAGASTVSELAVVKKPALLVPYPFASENHQWANALVLKDRGAVVCDEKELTDGRMANMLGSLMRDEKRRMMLSVAYGELGQIHRQAAQAGAAVVLLSLQPFYNPLRAT